MSVYNVYGDELLVINDVHGNVLSEAYDLTGQIVRNPIEDIPSYYRERTQQVAQQINSLGNGWQSFVFVTDPHYPHVEPSSQPISLYLLNQTNVSMLVLGGDYCEGGWGRNWFNTWTSDFSSYSDKSRIHCLFGNHERFGGSASLPDALDAIYKAFIKDKLSFISGSPETDYYYYDNVPAKTRFVFLNTSDDGTTTISATQLAWVETAVHLPDETWSVVILAHVNMMVGVGLLTNKNDLINAIETCNGSIVGYICGHQHLDAVTKISDGFYELTLLCDRFEDYTTPREAGTITENVVSVISFNTTTKEVVMRRIGAGNNNTLSYSYSV